jgi:hypothetical protein
MTPQGSGDPAVTLARDADRLVVPHDAAFCDRCFVCGAPTAGKPIAMHLHVANTYRRKVFSTTASSALAVLDLLAYVVFVFAFVVDLPASLRRRIQFGLCARHRAKRRWLRGAAASSSLAGSLLVVAAIGFPFSTGAGAAVMFTGLGLIFAAALVSGMDVGPRLATANARFFWLAGAGEEFLAAYPAVVKTRPG